MKNKSISKVGGVVAVAAVASLAMLGSAQADQMTGNNGELGIYASDFGKLDTSARAPEFDSGQYERVNLGPLSATLWAPKRGAAGPMRDDGSAHEKQMQLQDIQKRLGPVGGSDTP